jgi:hypothetical protein
MTVFATVPLRNCRVFLRDTIMAKKTRPNTGDNATSSPAQPRAGRRMTGRQPASDNAEPTGVRHDIAQEPPESGRRETSAHVEQDSQAQDFGPAPQTGQYESTPSQPSEHEIRLRAYLRYLDRGAFDGADFDDWLQAEMELKKR